MRRIAATVLTLALGVAGLVASAGADSSHTYKIEMLDAFGIVDGSEVRVAGVVAGTVTELEITARKRALATVELSGPLAELGERTTCRTQPQSLIAEYFIDCEPRGPSLPEEATIPAEQVRGTVQTDLLLNTFRDSYAERLRLIVNELGTAIAGNSENLNAELRLALPALGELRGVTSILARQRGALARLNVNAEAVITRLAQRRGDVAAAIVETRDTAVVAAERRADLAVDADRLDDFLAELRPTLAGLGGTARAGTPLLTRLREAAPSLNRLAAHLPAFGAATEQRAGHAGPGGRSRTGGAGARSRRGREP